MSKSRQRRLHRANLEVHAVKRFLIRAYSAGANRGEAVCFGAGRKHQNCKDQHIGGNGCGSELDDWFAGLLQAERQATRPPSPPDRDRPLPLGDLPRDCRTVLTFGGHTARALTIFLRPKCKLEEL
jgi:hypothetical protein